MPPRFSRVTAITVESLEDMELTDYLAIVRKYWVSILACFLTCIAVAGTVSLLMKPVYTASTAVFLTVQSGNTAADLNQGSSYAENQVRSYAQVVTTPVVLQPVIDQLGLPTTPEKLAEHVTATVPTNTAIIRVDVDGGDPAQTATIANAISEELTRIVYELSPQASDGSKSVKATVIAPASVPTQWTSPRVLLNLALGALVGLLVGIGQAVLRSRLDTRVLSEHDVAEVTDRSVVGTIVFDTDVDRYPIVVHSDPHSVRAEAYRRLRTNLQFLELGGHRRSIVITSSVAGEGKTTTSINIAGALAEAGQSVLLVDADLRRPMVAGELALDGTVGLTTVLIGRATLGEVVQPVSQGNLHVLPSGEVPPNPSELLGSEPMRKLLAEATERYDLVIIDSPPVLPVTDSTVLTRACGGALIVVGSGTVTKPELAAAIDALQTVEANILGLVLNGLNAEHAGHYGYHHYYQRKSPAAGQDHGIDEASRGESLRSAPVSPVEALEPNQ